MAWTMLWLNMVGDLACNFKMWAPFMFKKSSKFYTVSILNYFSYKNIWYAIYSSICGPHTPFVAHIHHSIHLASLFTRCPLNTDFGRPPYCFTMYWNMALASRHFAGILCFGLASVPSFTMNLRLVKTSLSVARHTDTMIDRKRLKRQVGMAVTLGRLHNFFRCLVLNLITAVAALSAVCFGISVNTDCF